MLLLPGCAHNLKLPAKETLAVYTVSDFHDDQLSRFAPFYVIYDHEKNYNKIGSPFAYFDRNGDERVTMDPDTPAIYYMVRPFSTERGNYTNYIYRIHFSHVPFSLIPFHLTAGSNPGLITVVTVNSSGLPVLITTVHTCGCYLAITPTTYLADDSFPKAWKNIPLPVYGERLPATIDPGDTSASRILIHLRPAVHRVMDITVINKDRISMPDFYEIESPLRPVEELEYVPLNGGTTGLYYTEGLMRGHVKDSFKPWETLFLGLISLDFFVGSDKAYSDTASTGNPFYTSLKPWNRDKSNMWNFRRFLEFWGWRL